MVQNPLQAIRMDHICQTCGDKGFREGQLYCSKCQNSMEHKYCLMEFPDVDDEEFTYICEKCQGSNHLVKRKPPRKTLVSATLVQDLRKNLASSTLEIKAEENLQKEVSEVETCEVPSALGTPVPEPSIEDEMPQVDVNKTDKGPVPVQDSPRRISSFSNPSLTMAEAEERIHVAQPSPQTLEADLLVKDLPLLKRKRILIIDDSDESDEDITCVSYHQEPQAPPERKRRLILNSSDESDEEITLTGWQQPQASAIRKRRLILNDSDESDEESTLAGCQESQAAAAAPAPKILSPPQSDRAQPVIDPIWRGCFEICSDMYNGVVAHLSSNVGLKVAEVSKLMPGILSVEMVSRPDTWPKSFSISAPSDDNIALYFFPENEDAIKAVLFHELVTIIMDLDLALRVLFDEAELSIFPSNQLPQDLWMFRGRFYLWGVFRGRKDAPTPESSDGHRNEKASSACSVPLSAIGTIKNCKSLRISPPFPSSKDSSYSPWTVKRHKSNVESDCYTLPSSSNLTRTSPPNSVTPTAQTEICGKKNCGEGEITVKKNITSTSNNIAPGPYEGSEMLGKGDLPTTNPRHAGLGSKSSSSYPSNPPRTGQYPIENIASVRKAAFGTNKMSESSSSYPSKPPRTGKLPIKGNPNPKPSSPTSNIGYRSVSPRTGEYIAKVEETSCYTLPPQSDVLQPCPHIPLPQEKNKNQVGSDQKRQISKRDKTVDRDACFNCGEKGHWKRDCSKRQQGAGTVKGAEMYGKGELPTRNITKTGNASLGTIKKSEPSTPCISEERGPSNTKETALPCPPSQSSCFPRDTLPSEPVSLQQQPQIHSSYTATGYKQTSMIDKMHWETQLLREQSSKMNVQETWVRTKQHRTLPQPVNQVKLNSPAEYMSSVQVPLKAINSDSRVTAIVQMKRNRGGRDKDRKKNIEANLGKKCNQPRFAKKTNQEKNKQGLVCFFCQQPGHKRSDCGNFLALLEEQKKYLQSLVPEIRIIVQQQLNPSCMDRTTDCNLGADSLNGELERRQPPLPLYIEAPFNVRPS